MNDESLPPEEISRRIIAGMGLVYDLFQEVHSLIRLIAQGLANSEASIRPLTHNGVVLPRGNLPPAASDRFIKTDMGLLAEVGGTGPVDGDGDADDVNDEEGLDALDKGKIFITGESQYLGIRAILFDPQAKDLNKFQPVLVAGLLGSMTKQPTSGKGHSLPRESEFQVGRRALKLLVKQFEAGLKPGNSISAKIHKGILHANIGEAFVTPLGEISTEHKVNELVDRMADMAGN